MTSTQIVTLHAYVCHIIKELSHVEAYYKNLKDGLAVDYTSIRTILEQWKEDIASKALTEAIDLSIASTPPVSAAFGGPFENYSAIRIVL